VNYCSFETYVSIKRYR